MDDVTDVVFRELVTTTAKPDVMFTEFVSADGLVRGNKERVGRKLFFNETQRPIVAQIWGSTPEHFFQSAQMVKELGFDGIDINMACPAHAVMAKKSGAALIGNFEVAAELIDAVRRGCGDLPISVKTRLNKTPEDTQAWISFLLSQNISALTLHARTAKELSKVDAHWEEIGKAVKLRDSLAPETVIIGNGDVKSYANVLEKHKTYGVDGIMIGRGIFYNPWVFEKNENTTPHSTKNYIDLLLKHNEMFYQKYGDSKYFETLKKFFKMYVNNFKGADELRQTLMMCKNYQQVNDTIAKWNFPQIKK